MVAVTLVSYSGTFRCNSSGHSLDSPSSNPPTPGGGASLLFDEIYNTCIQPFDGQDSVLITFATPNTLSSPNVNVSIIGTGLECDQPTMLVFKTMSCGAMNAGLEQCGLSKRRIRQRQVECRYYCDIFLPCNAPARISLKMTRTAWMGSIINMTQLCDIRAFMLI